MSEQDQDIAWPPDLENGERLLHACLRTELADFEVEEIAKFTPSGRGEHLWLWVEKRGLETSSAAGRLAKAFGVAPREVSFAGRKDRHAVTRQWFSLPASARPLPQMEGDDLVVLEAARNERKLALGALHGNRFAITLRGLEPGADQELAARIARRRPRGLPNAFGPQRFGRRQDNHRLGLALLRGDAFALVGLIARPSHVPEHPSIQAARQALAAGDLAAVRFPPSFVFERALVRAHAQGLDGMALREALPWRESELLVSAFQAAGFQRVLRARWPDQLRPLEGDLLRFATNATVFRVEDPAQEALRCARFEVLPTGPMVGARVMEPTGAARSLELEALGPYVLAADAVRPPPGERRPLVWPFPDIEIDAPDMDATAVRLRFSLREGAFATGLLASLGLAVEDVGGR